MRLGAIDRSHRFKEWLILGIVQLASGDKPDILKTLFHRPEFFGRPLGAITTRAMRGASDWSVAEREMFAAFVSKQNRCEYCVACHTEYACQAGDRALVDETLRSETNNDPRINAALAFLKAFATGPAALTTEHVKRLRAANVGEAAIRDLAQIGFSFCIINRVADALEFRVSSRTDFAQAWPSIRDRGYRV